MGFRGRPGEKYVELTESMCFEGYSASKLMRLSFCKISEEGDSRATICLPMLVDHRMTVMDSSIVYVDIYISYQRDEAPRIRSQSQLNVYNPIIV
jgi:hypothetical protein